jgi:hypothetical protein
MATADVDCSDAVAQVDADVIEEAARVDVRAGEGERNDAVPSASSAIEAVYVRIPRGCLARRGIERGEIVTRLASHRRERTSGVDR